jgi:hypothetical protein
MIIYCGGLWVLVSGHIDMKQISSRVYLFTDHFCRIRFVFIFSPGFLYTPDPDLVVICSDQ